MRVLFLFLDGVGAGSDDPAVNPFRAAELPALRSLCGGLPPFAAPPAGTTGSVLLHLDATLGVVGLPQSGTGQTALFTGVNAAQLIGKHFGPYPYSSLRPILREHGIMPRLVRAGRRCVFANAFPDRFFRYMQDRPARITATTMSVLGAGLPLAGLAELTSGTAVSADVTGEGWKALGHPEVAVLTPGEAGRRLAALAHAHEFTLFEYWHTDRAGHTQDMAEAVRVLERLDGMLEGVLDALDFSTTLLLITSDHGNVEDLGVKTHTLNPVPLLLRGARAADLAAGIIRSAAGAPDLTHVAPAVLGLFKTE